MLSRVKKESLNFLIITVALLSLALLPRTSSAQAGANLSLPFARRSMVTGGFGGGHNGVDYRAATGTPVVAARSGTVTRADNVCPCNDCCHDPSDPGYNGGYGNLVEIDHGSGFRAYPKSPAARKLIQAQAK